MLKTSMNGAAAAVREDQRRADELGFVAGGRAKTGFFSVAVPPPGECPLGLWA